MPVTKQYIYFRADGNTEIGLGHVIRSLALAEMLKAEFECVFMIQAPSTALKKQILETCQNLIELPETKDYSTESQQIVQHYIKKEAIIVLDGYFFTTAYQEQIKTAGHQLVFIDDLKAWDIPADVIINHSGSAKKEAYHAALFTQFCLGLKYALLRSPFLKASEQPRSLDTFDTALVCLGGADTANKTIHILKKIEKKIPSIQTCIVITGSAYPYLSQLTSYIQSAAIKIKHLSNLNAQEMVNAMQESQIAICSASGIAYEYMAIKGGLFVVKTADNQNDIYQYLLEHGLADDFKNLKASYPIHRHIQTQEKLFDGQISQRFQTVFHRLQQKLNLRIRLANIDDMMTYFHWANDPDVRKNAINQSTIPLENHRAWFSKKVNNTTTVMYIFSLKNGEDIGQVRLDIQSQQVFIDYSIDSKYRGQGWGKLILERAILEFLKIYPKKEIIGQVKDNNIGSIKCFQYLNFIEIEKENHLRVFKFKCTTIKSVDEK